MQITPSISTLNKCNQIIPINNADNANYNNNDDDAKYNDNICNNIGNNIDNEYRIANFRRLFAAIDENNSNKYDKGEKSIVSGWDGKYSFDKLNSADAS